MKQGSMANSQPFQRCLGFARDTPVRHSLGKHAQEIPSLRRTDALEHCHAAQLAQGFAGRRLFQILQQLLDAAACCFSLRYNTA